MKTDTRKSAAGLLCAVALILLAEFLPLPAGATRTGFLSFAVFFGAIVLWILNALPMCVTALLMMFLMPALGILDLDPSGDVRIDLVKARKFRLVIRRVVAAFLHLFDFFFINRRFACV